MARKKKFDDSGRPHLPKGMKYRIDKVPEHSLHILSLCNRGFAGDIKFIFSEDFVIFDPTSAASTSVAAKMQTTGDEDQSHVVTGDDDYDDFITGPTQEFLRKARLAKPVSTEQLSKRRKTVMFQKHEDEYTGSVIHITNDEPSVLEPLKTEIQDCVHIHTECPTIAEVQFDQKDEHMNDQEEGHEEESKNTHITEMEDISDEHIATKESCCADILIKHHSTDVTDLQDDVNAILTEFVQDALDTLIFGLSTPSNTNKFDVVTPNLVTESQWSLPDSQFPPDFLDAQVRELEAAEAREVKHKSPIKRDRKKSKIFRLAYITKFGSSSKDEGRSDNEEKQRKQTDNHYLKNAPRLDYPLLDFIVAQALSKNWFYLMTQPKMCWNDEERTIRVYDSLSSKKKSEAPTEIRKLAVMLPTYLSDSDFIEKTKRIDWSTLKACEGKLGLQTSEISHNPFDVEYVQNIPQQVSDSLDCGVFVAAYTEILTEGQQVHSCEFEAASQRARYASLL
ncbi:hypothetical protein CQW23_04836 [Capsicum baccatum]|uniref:Ubiquitin-like protease family profile domain-containing protein n=1 Tax=Capsicum baccatum TaxID=33114 RepID=A0A2G2XFU2_CAPBA|nr:hypothetical protein CQW23_04836 [Capsicum baccatum]